MKKKITVWTICFVAIFAVSGLAFAQTAKPAAMKTVKLPNGAEVCDLTGEWDALIDNYGEWAEFGSYPNIIKVILVGNSFRGIRLMDNGPGEPPNSMIIEIDLEKNGFKHVVLSEGTKPCPCNGKLSEDGNKILLDLENRVRLTMTRK
jgi:hypothetical protein